MHIRGAAWWQSLPLTSTELRFPCPLFTSMSSPGLTENSQRNPCRWNFILCFFFAAFLYRFYLRAWVHSSVCVAYRWWVTKKQKLNFSWIWLFRQYKLMKAWLVSLYCHVILTRLIPETNKLMLHADLGLWVLYCCVLSSIRWTTPDSHSYEAVFILKEKYKIPGRSGQLLE